ncbi:cysteine--tRNA ligase-like protein, mitochondrial isoform X1 [Halictus rubicundus]|uniref:cysteine--tRNA ligase-like protein, mitochondrial isoform X1 n=1 Tax=Halictus rubicundus TaxID=77578 RepID=UPI0040353969
MHLITRNLKHKLRTMCHRSLHDTKQKQKPQWVKPVGYETNIKVYNTATKCTVPLILKNKNYLTWYVCGPTVYDSAHIGHAATYVKTDIIRRILTDHFNINVVMAMSVTNIDDKIINRANATSRNFEELSQHFETEFMEDMQMLNVWKPNLYCRVTDFIPQIIDFINNIVNKEGAYVGKDGSVYFDVNKHGIYGKLSTPFQDSSHPHKKSALDFTLWKASKKGEPFWESPWGNGRPGWHIECSTIASTVFGNSIDIHSGAIDLVFPHHENEEAQSCSYHEVDQWVNYWLHCGHLLLKDVKMSKSLQNTISIRKLLQRYTANQFRMLCLLSNYDNDIEFCDDVMNNAVNIMNKVEHFIATCDNYVVGKWTTGNVDEVALLRCLEETKNNVDAAFANNFNTAQATHTILNLVDIGNKMLHDSSKPSINRSIPAVTTVSNYVSTMFSKLGIGRSEVADEYKVNNLIEYFIKFRKRVRNRIKEQGAPDNVMLTACDEARADLLKCGVIVKDSKTDTTWSIKSY